MLKGGKDKKLIKAIAELRPVESAGGSQELIEVHSLHQTGILKGLDHVQHGVAGAGTQVEDLAAQILGGILDCSHMALGQVHHMDVVPDAGAVVLFVALAPANKRGTATSTYLTSWDIGIGIGLFLGGMLSQYTSFSTTFLFGAILGLLSLIIFITFTSHHFIKNRLNEV